MRINSRLRCRLTCCIVITLALLSGQVMAASKPVIHVIFEYDIAEPHNSHLKEPRRTDLADKVVKQFIEYAQKEWAYIHWSSDNPLVTGTASTVSQTRDATSVTQTPTGITQNADPEAEAVVPTSEAAIWKIQLKLIGPIVEDNDDGFKTTLHHYKSDTGRAFSELALTPDLKIVYRPKNDFSFYSPSSLEVDLEARLASQLPILFKEKNTGSISKFIKSVPLSKSVIADTENLAVVIPFSFSDLNADTGTLLEIEFVYNGIEGSIQMKPGKYPLKNDKENCVTGKLDDLDLFRQSLGADFDGYYDPKFESFFATDQNESVKVLNYESKGFTDEEVGHVDLPGEQEVACSIAK